jgi:hypothetical protein
MSNFRPLSIFVFVTFFVLILYLKIHNYLSPLDEPKLFFVFIIVFIISFQIDSYFGERYLGQKFQNEVMPDLGGTYVRSQNPNKISPDLHPLLKWSTGKKGELKNVVTKQINGVEIYLFTYTYRIVRNTTRRKTYYSPEHYTVAAILTEPGHLPEFFIRQPNFIDGFQKSSGKNFLEIPAAHSLVVQVYGEDKHNPFVFKHVPEEAWTILRRYDMSCVHRGNCFLMYQFDALEDNAQTYQEFFERAETVYRHFLHSTTAG